MKILILNQAFYPDIVATAQHATDLALALTEAGHSVTVVSSRRGYDDPAWTFPKHERWKSIEIVRIPSTGLGKKHKWRRVVDFATFLMACFLRILVLPRFDVIVTLTSPPLISFFAALVVPFKASRLVFWSMDLNPDEAIAAGWLNEGSLAARLLSRMLRYSLHKADAVIVLDRFMKERVLAKQIDDAKIVVIPPWSHDDLVHFDAAGREEFRAHYGLENKFVVMYSGNHSPCHPLDTLIAAADRLAGHEEIAFCFVGGGSEFEKVKDDVRRRGMRNVLSIPYQPMGNLAASLSAADLHVVVMGDGFVGIVHPCKIYNILAVGKPFLYIGPPQSHVSDIAGMYPNLAFGYSSRHGDIEAVVASIRDAKSNNLHGCPDNVVASFSRDVLMPEMIAAVDGMPARLQRKKPQREAAVPRPGEARSLRR
jgi:putative colanic acid biosynthesis glycosyltransferase WcaI